jgi:hypothetical protein
MDQDGLRLDGATVEHIIPLTLGGGDGLDNLVAACVACNQARSAFDDAVAFAGIRLRLLRKGHWPACTAPTKRIRRKLLAFFTGSEADRLAKAWIEARKKSRDPRVSPFPP